MKKHLPQYSKSLVPIARVLRRQMTDAERKLWSLLRRNQLGLKFRRQVPLGPYIVDFYCVKARLMVELDGSQHYSSEGMRNDVERDEYLRAMGQEVVRYSNLDVLQNEDGVVQDIIEHVKLRSALVSDPLWSPLEGDGRGV